MNIDENFEPLTERFVPSRRIQKKLDDLIREDREQQSRTWEYYQQMKRDDPSRYWRADTQAQLHRDAETLQDEFNF